MDQDTRAVVEFLGAALQDSGLTQAAFATALGTSPSRLSTYLGGTVRPSAHFCFRADRIGRALGAAARRGLVTPPVAGEQVRRALRDAEQAWVWRGLLQCRDHLRLGLTSDVAEAASAWEAAPGSLGDPGWDGLFAAVVQREYASVEVQPPTWTDRPPMEHEWMPEHPFLSPSRIRQQTPQWLRELNLFVPERDLVTA